MASWQRGGGAKAVRLCGNPTSLHVHIFISVVFVSFLFFFPPPNAPIVKLRPRKVSRWDPAQTGNAAAFSLNRSRGAQRQAELSGSSSLFSIIPLELVADEEVMACDGKRDSWEWCDYNQAWTLNYRTSLMIFSKSSKEGRREEKLLFDLWKVSSHSHFIAVGQRPRGSEHLFSISVQEERKLRWKQQKTLGEKENRKKNTRKNKSVWNESGWKMKEKTKRNKK